MKTCLGCKYEPDWGDWSTVRRPQQRYGKCKWVEAHPLPPMPKALSVQNQTLVQYQNSGVILVHCPCWAAR